MFSETLHLSWVNKSSFSDKTYSRHFLVVLVQALGNCRQTQTHRQTDTETDRQTRSVANSLLLADYLPFYEVISARPVKEERKKGEAVSQSVSLTMYIACYYTPLYVSQPGRAIEGYSVPGSIVHSSVFMAIAANTIHLSK